MKRFTIIISFIMLTFMLLMAQVKKTYPLFSVTRIPLSRGFIPKGYATCTHLPLHQKLQM